MKELLLYLKFLRGIYKHLRGFGIKHGTYFFVPLSQKILFRDQHCRERLSIQSRVSHATIFK